MSLTRDQIEAQGWMGDQRGQVLELLAERDGARAKAAVLEAECTRRAQDQAVLRGRAELAERALAQRTELAKLDLDCVELFVSRDLVARALDELQELVIDGYDLGVGKSRVHRCRLLLCEALGGGT